MLLTNYEIKQLSCFLCTATRNCCVKNTVKKLISIYRINRYRYQGTGTGNVLVFYETVKLYWVQQEMYRYGDFLYLN
jgi:hypothetical protein